MTLATINKQLILDNAADGIPTIPVIDSAIVPAPEDLQARHRAEFRTAWRLGKGVADLTGGTQRVKLSNGESYRFFGELPQPQNQDQKPTDQQ